MRHLDLFSGIGGFALATEMAWPDEEVEHIFCDNDPFAQAILKKHWPNSLIYGDIKTLTAERIIADTKSLRRGTQRSESEGQQRKSEPDNETERIDILTGGFPCQPFSSAGRRRGTEDDRHLWPEMLRLIRETNPTFILGENVGGLITWDGGMVLEMVLSDLEEAGYEAGAFIIPACALNAPHRRDRVWIAARSKSAPNPTSLLGNGSEDNVRERDQGKSLPQLGNSGGEGTSFSWNQPWPEVAARLCTMDDGLSNGLARPRGWRNAALKGAGNAIVPQVAAEILRMMK